jgi:phage-related holin
MKEFFANPIIKPVALLTVAPNALIAPTVKLELVVFILVSLFVFDLFSGLLASYFVWEKEPEKGKYFFGCDKGFSSDKFKKCFVKGMVYGGFPLIVLKFQEAFLIKNIKFPAVTTAEFNITVICLLVFCANELFSIFWENLPKCGLDLPKGIRNFITGVKGINEEVKEQP